MRKYLALFLGFILITSAASSQIQGIKGLVKDSIGHKVIENALVTLVRTKDSLITSYCYTDSIGSYVFKNLLPERYKLIISYPGYADFVEDTTLAEFQFIDLGSQYLTSKFRIMQEVVVRQIKTAMVVRNDTLEFVADSFQVKPDATIEDLLKALPGISVNREGKVTVHGQRVNQVLVDGEEFFGIDPTIVTQNLPSKIVDKVQVYDKKSEMAKLTGIDDGKTSKVINVKLKDNSKKGFFGKVMLGANLENNWNNNLLINAFKNKRQLSVFAMTSNIGKTLIDKNDQTKFGFKLNDKIGNGISTLSDSYYDVGIPRSTGAGVHYANKWKDDKQGFNTNLIVGQFNNKGQQTISTQLFLDDSIILNSENYLVDNNRTEISWDGKYEVKIDSTSSISTSAKARYGKLIVNNFLASETRDQIYLINTSNRSFNSTSDFNNYNNEISWKKRLNNKGKNISATVRYEYLANQASAILKAVNMYYLKDGSLNNSDTINYKRDNSSKDYTLNSKISYRQPVFKKAFLDVNYGFSTSSYFSEWLTYHNDKVANSVPIDSLSSEYRYSIIMNNGGPSITVPKNKYSFSLGQNLSLTKYIQRDFKTKSLNNFSFFNLLPTASIRYAFSKLTHLSLTYTTNNKPPSLQQIQPVTDNTNPNILYKGNSHLKQEFSNNYSVLFNSLKPVESKTLYSMFSLTTVKNSIGYNDYIDFAGKRFIQPINTDGALQIFSYINYSYELKKIKTNWTNDITVLYNRGINFINSVRNRTDNSIYTYTTSLSKNNKKISLQLNSSVSYNIIKYSIMRYGESKFWSASNYVTVGSELPGNLSIGSDCQVSLQQSSPYFDRPNSIIRWNAYVSKKIFKNTSNSLRLSVNNILNQNNGYSRFASGSYVSERLNQTLGRYWLLSFTLNFNNQDKK